MEWCELRKLAGASSLSDVSNVVYSMLLSPCGNPVKQLPTSNFLENQIEFVWFFKVLDQIDDVLVTLHS